MSFAFNSIYSYFLFLYHVLLKSIFYFNALGSVMDLISPHLLPPEHVKVHIMQTPQKRFLKHHGFLYLSVFLRLFFWKQAGDTAMRLGKAQNLQADWLAQCGVYPLSPL